jgi:hypothetical protein
MSLTFPTPSDEQWSIRIEQGVDSPELIAIGPKRGREAQVGWQAEPLSGGVLYRRLLPGADDRRPQAIRRALRSLIWHRIVFRANPIDSLDLALADAFEETVRETLRRRHGVVQVRFNVWQDGDERRFVCKVEALPNGSAEADRRWWSPLVRTPQELGAALAAAYPPEPGEGDALAGLGPESLRKSAGLVAPSGA